jgi:hypothetical protein
MVLIHTDGDALHLATGDLERSTGVDDAGLVVRPRWLQKLAAHVQLRDRRIRRCDRTSRKFYRRLDLYFEG